MGREKHIAIGVIAKPHGLKGHVSIKVEANYSFQFPDFNSVFINHAGAFVPYVIEAYAELNKGMAKVKLMGIDTQEAANQLRGQEVFQAVDRLTIDKQLDLVGFRIVDASYGDVGEVLSVIESTAQTLLEVSFNDAESYIPFVDDFLIEIDQKAHVIHMNLPEGMLDL